MSGRKHQKLLRNLDEIYHLFKEGTTVVLHSGFAEPKGLALQLECNAAALNGVEVYSLMPMGKSPYASEEAAQHLSVHAFFPGKGLRSAVNNGRAQLHRIALSEIPKLFSQGKIKADILMLQVSQPNAAGEMTLGVSVDYMREVLKQDPVVIAEINPQMPRTCGDTIICGDQIDYIFETETDLQCMEVVKPDAVDLRIADNIAGLVSNGAVLQTGIGAISELVLSRLTHLSNLGIHTGIITDGLMHLLKSGAITNGNKSRFRGKCITTMAGGTQAFYDFLHENKEIEFHPCSLTHSLEVLAGIEGLCAINSALQIDLTGKVNAEVINKRVISSPGGLPDFAQGASIAPKGKSIIALRSTDKDGKNCNIVPKLPEGAHTTVLAEHVDFVVTEHGVARFRGLSHEDRLAEILSIAPVEFRSLLKSSSLS